MKKPGEGRKVLKAIQDEKSDYVFKKETVNLENHE